jgi:hypothetical protein
MSRLTEDYVKFTTIAHLETYYSKKHKIEKKEIFSRAELWKKSKNGRPDGFLCFDSPSQPKHTVSIEAKSHKTLDSLLPFYNYSKSDDFAGYLSLSIAMVSIYPIWSFKWYWILLFCAIIFLVVFLALLAITSKIRLSVFNIAYVVNQINNYPANERWITISTDSLNLLQKRKPLLNGDNYENLIRICKRKKVGFIIVNRKEAKIILEPKFRKGNYLKHYCRESDIVSHLVK